MKEYSEDTSWLAALRQGASQLPQLPQLPAVDVPSTLQQAIVKGQSSEESNRAQYILSFRIFLELATSKTDKLCLVHHHANIIKINNVPHKITEREKQNLGHAGSCRVSADPRGNPRISCQVDHRKWRKMMRHLG